MRIRYITLLTAFVMIVMNVSAQSSADNGISRESYGLVRTNMNTSYSHGWATIEDVFSARVSYELIRNRNITLTANARYSSCEVSFDDGDLSDSYNPNEINLNGTHLLGQVGVTSTFRLKLFGKPCVGMAMLNSEWGEGGFARISGIAMWLFMIKANRDTQFGIGPLVMINSTSKVPAFIVFMYRHRFNEKWLVNLYGGMFSVDYTPTKNNLISIGADVDVNSFYFKPSDTRLPSRCRFTSTSFRPMARYRHRLAENLYFDTQAGVSLKMSSRINGVTGTKEYVECKQKAAPFIHFGVSYSL